MRALLRRLLLPVCALVSAVLVLGTLSAPANGAPGDPEPTPSTPEAAAALEHVEELLSGEVTTTTEGGPAGPDLTLALRDLRLHMPELSSRDRAAARVLTARPASDRYRDFGSVRVHWRAADSGVTSAWVDTVGATVNRVLSVYRGAGYRAPKPDGTVGGGRNLLDIYLVDFAAAGRSGLYGYCDASEPPLPQGPYDVAAFCAFDHNFSAFPRTPLANLQVTAAHELFHAVQFAYDYREDAWFLESTATWAEDELYDAINDNRQYLAQSPLRQPRESLDQFGDGLRQYGGWIFFRYLTERYPAKSGSLPVIIRRMLERADGAAGGKDLYSIQAVSRELKSRGTTLPRVYAQFGDANRRPRRTYEEGAAYRAAPAVKGWKLGKRAKVGWQRLRVDHLATATVAVRPDQRNRKLRIQLDLPNVSRGAAAVVTRYDARGRAHAKVVKLSRTGGATVKVGFDKRRVRRVDITLANASTRYRCWQGRVNNVLYSCAGRPLDDNRVLRYRLQVVR